MTVTLNWNGNNVGRTVGNVTRTERRAPSFGGVVWEREWKTAVGGGQIEVGEAYPPPRDIVFYVRSDCYSAGGTDAVIEARAQDEMNDLAEEFHPGLGEVDLKVTRLDTSSSSVVRYLRAKALGAMAWRYTDRGGDDELGVRPKGYIHYDVFARADYPWFIDHGTPTPTSLSSGGGGTAVTNSGAYEVGWRLVITAASGDRTTLTLTNSTTSQSAVFKFSGGAVVANRAIEWWYPQGINPFGVTTINTSTSATRVVYPQPGSHMMLAKGSNTISMTVSGGSTGTASASLYVANIWESI